MASRPTGDKVRATPTPVILDGRIDAIEAIGILVMAVTMKAFLALPERMARQAQTAAWSVPFASALLSASWIIPLVAVLRAHPGENIVDISKKLMGKFIGSLFGFLFFLLGIGLCAACAYQIGSTLVSVVLPLTPRNMLIALKLALAVYITLQGIEVMGRLSAIMAAVVLVSVAVLVGFNYASWDLGQIYPLQGPGLLGLAKTYLMRQAIYDELLVIGLISPYLRDRRQTGKVAFWGTTISALLLFLAVAGSQVVLAYPSLVQNSAPLLLVARNAHLSRFLKRFDALLVFAWLGSAGVRMALGVYSGSLSLSSALGLKTYRPILPVTAAAILLVTALIPDISSAIVLDFDILRPLSVPVLLGWPWLLLVLTWIKGAAGAKKGAK